MQVNKDYLYRTFDNLKKDISSINPFIQFFIYLLLMIVGVVLLLLIFFLWLFIDLLPLILVPVLGILLLVPATVVTGLFRKQDNEDIGIS
jgi:fatty acid desaturase